MKNALVAGVVLLGAMALGGCGGADQPQKITVGGTLHVSGATDTINDTDSGNTCESSADGYRDLNEGAQVVVKNSSGKQVGVGDLSSGTISDDSLSCDFQFRVTVPGDDSYSVTIANRKPYSFNAEDAGDLELSLTD